MDTSELKFEQAMERLEEIVRRLEEGDVSLDETMKLFEEGVKLAGECEKRLRDAQGKLELLTKNADGSLGTEALDL